MARVRMLYFAGVRDLLGTSEETLELPEHVRTIGDLASWMIARGSIDAARMAHVRIARNEEFADPSEAIADGDVIAWIPPVAGGS